MRPEISVRPAANHDSPPRWRSDHGSPATRGDAARANHPARANDGACLHRAQGNEACCQQYGNHQMFHDGSPRVVTLWFGPFRVVWRLGPYRLDRRGNGGPLRQRCASVLNQALQPMGCHVQRDSIDRAWRPRRRSSRPPPSALPDECSTDRQGDRRLPQKRQYQQAGKIAANAAISSTSCSSLQSPCRLPAAGLVETCATVKYQRPRRLTMRKPVGERKEN
jgi:hypothetical protein